MQSKYAKYKTSANKKYCYYPISAQVLYSDVEQNSAANGRLRPVPDPGVGFLGISPGAMGSFWALRRNCSSDYAQYY